MRSLESVAGTSVKSEDARTSLGEVTCFLKASLILMMQKMQATGFSLLMQQDVDNASWTDVETV